MNTPSALQLGPNRWVAALVALALAFAGLTLLLRPASAAPWLPPDASGERTIGMLDEGQPAKIERCAELSAERSEAEPTPPASRAAAAKLSPPRLDERFFVSLAPAGREPAHRRPDPTGPPILG